MLTRLFLCGILLLGALGLVSASPSGVEAHLTNYGHWHYYGDADWGTYCGPYDIPNHGPANCYWPSSSTAQCNTFNHKWYILIRVQYFNGDWNQALYYYGSC